MAEKLFKQAEVNRIVASRLQRERERLTREYENSLKRCMAAVHLTLHQEMCSMKNDMEAETQFALTKDTLWSAPIPVDTAASPCQSGTNDTARGGENK